jgi:hypothetical protein
MIPRPISGPTVKQGAHRALLARGGMTILGQRALPDEFALFHDDLHIAVHIALGVVGNLSDNSAHDHLLS